MKNRIKSFTPALALSFAFCFMIFIYAPMELYFENKSEYWFDIRHLLPVCLMMFLTVFALSVAAMLIVRLINIKLYYGCTILYFIAYICTYIQGNYLAGNLPALDGAAVPWDLYDYQRKYCIILWITVIAVMALLYKFTNINTVVNWTKWLPLAVSAVLFITLGVVCINNDGLSKKLSIAVSTDYELEMSTDKNFVIFVMDSMDGARLEELFDTHPEYSEVMKDFTYFDNTMAVYPYTEFAAPFILSGDWFECDEYIDEYKRNVYGNATILNNLEERGYRLGLYEAEAPLTDEYMYRFENVKDVENEFTSVWDFIKVEMRLVGLRYAPYDLKQRCLVMPEEIPNLRKQVNGIEYVKFTDSNMTLCNAIKEKGITFTDDKCFKYIHIEAAHIPFRYDENLNIVDNADYTSNMEAAMTVLMEYINALKENGVYDNTAILITADHGYNTEDEASITPEKRQHAILFVKGFDEQHNEMTISSAPISHEDYQQAYVRLLDGADSSQVFDWKDGDYRERRYLYFYLWDMNNMDEYIQTGYAGDESTMIPTGVTFVQQY
jgi:hypothetical protein